VNELLRQMLDCLSDWGELSEMFLQLQVLLVLITAFPEVLFV
jgi:hypothetical protein